MQDYLFLKHLSAQKSVVDFGNGFAKKMKQATFNAALTNGPPHPKLPTWKYGNLQNLLDTAFNLAVPTLSDKAKHAIQKVLKNNQIDASTLVFINGEYQKNFSQLHSSSPIFLIKLRDLADVSSSQYDEKMRQSCHSSDFFSQLNGGLATDSFLLSIPKNSHLLKPLIIYHFMINEQTTPLMINPQLHLILEEDAKLCLIEKTIMLSSALLVNSQTFLSCQDKSNLTYFRMSEDEKNNYHIRHLYCSQFKNSTLKMTDLTLGSHYHRNDNHYELMGSHAKTECYHLILPKANQHYDCVSRLEHHVPQCESYQLIKAIAQDYAHSSFQGSILVKQQAPQTIAKMKNENLFLGDKGRIDAVPQLEIYTDDVQCHHGAVISSLEPSSLFYLLARGLKENEAKRILIFAFIDEIIDQCISPIKKNVRSHIHQYINAMLSKSKP